MAFQILARKWRPKIFSEVIGQSHVVNSLLYSLRSNKLAHAYLFTGTRGIGKTTLARIFGRSLRCERLKENGDPCFQCSSCLDFENSTSLNYIEIDGASNNGVDAIRQLIENIQYLPTSGSRKVYVIDEVHMLSTSAFNALLKTLEEPPSHVTFIFATTEPEKLLGTVLSRCQRYDLRSPALGDLIQYIQKLSQKEQIEFESPEALAELCRQGRGSIRDTLSLLDQVRSIAAEGRLTLDQILGSLGLAKTTAINQMIVGMLSGNWKIVSTLWQDIHKENIEIKRFTHQLGERFYQIIQDADEPQKLARENIPAEILSQTSTAELLWIFECMVKDFSWAVESILPQESVQLILQKLTLRRQLFAQDDKKKSITPEPIPSKKLNWDDFLEVLKSKNQGIYANLVHGHFLTSPEEVQHSKRAEFYFSYDANLFFLYCSNPETRRKTSEFLNEFLQVKIETLEIGIFKDQSEQRKKNFSSFNDSIERAKKNQESDLKNKLLTNSIVKQAEELFGVKVQEYTINKGQET